MVAFPLDIWFMVFDLISDHEILWSFLRNVSQHLRISVDVYFQHYVLDDTVIDLTYSTIHTQDGPSLHEILHVPVRFDRLSEDGTRAIYRRVHSRFSDSRPIWGSVRGWVPFIERYRRETGKPLPKVTHKDLGINGKPAWEEEYNAMRTITGYATPTRRLRVLRDLTSIGRGDRPPHFLRVSNDAHDTPAHDTELHGLEIDCKAREISILWRETLSAFYMEARFVTLAQQRRGKLQHKVYDEHLDAAAREVLMAPCIRYVNRYNNHWRRARRKRLAPWVAKNRSRMSDIHRLVVEDSVYDCMQYFSSHAFAPENLVEVEDDEVEKEVVPERCACDCKALMKWPRGNWEWSELESVYPRPRQKCKGCSVM